MDLLKSLIVPPALPGTPTSEISESLQHSSCTTVTSGQASASYTPPKAPTAPRAHFTAMNESMTTPNKNKYKKHRHKQSKPEQKKVTVAPISSVSAAITKPSKRKRSYLFHPDRPKGALNRRAAVSHEDLYDGISAQQPIPSTRNSQAEAQSKSNPESKQTCFFWYHGSCRRSWDKQGCQLRHALQDPPSMVVAPPKFVHPRPCNLEWCAGDSPRKKQKVLGGARAEQKRYFEAAVSDGTPAHKTAGEMENEESEFFLSGFEEPSP